MATTMKSSTQVTDIIRNYLEQRCNEEPMFALKYANPSKSIEGAVNYLCHEVQKSGLTMMDSDTVFSIITHYFDEDSLDEQPSINCKIAVAKELSVEEQAQVREQAKQEAMERLRREEMAKLTANTAKPKTTDTEKKKQDNQPNLFDF